MTTAGPWSVKGIDPKAREIAKDLARRSGLTLGEWLNQMITDTGESEAPPAPVADPWAEPPASLARGPDAPGFGAESFRSRLRDAGRAAEAAEMSRVTRALNDLSTRMEAAEHRSTLAISGIDQQVMGVLSRIEDGEHGSAAATARFDGALDEVRRTQDQIAGRIAALGEHDGPRIEAMKSLEASLAKMASQIHEGESRARAATAEVREGLSGLTRRLDRAEAASAATGTGTGPGSGKAGEAAFARMMERLDAAEARTTAAVRGLETSFAGLDARLKRAEGGPNLDKRFADLAAELQAKVSGDRSGMAARLRDAADDPRLDRMEQVLRDMTGQVGRAEKRSADALERMGHEVMRVAQSLSGRMDKVETAGVAVADRVSGEVARIAEAVQAHAQRGDDLQAKALERLGGEIARIAETLTQRIAESETRASKALDALGDRLGDRLGHTSPPPMVESAPAPARTPDLMDAVPVYSPTLSQFTAEPEFYAPDSDPFASPDPFASIGVAAPAPPLRDPDLDFAPPAHASEAHTLEADKFGADEPHVDEARADEARTDETHVDEDVFAPFVESDASSAADPFDDYPPLKSEPPHTPPREVPPPVHDPFEAEDHGIFAAAPPPSTPELDPRPRSSTRDLIEQARAAAREAAEAKPRRGGRTAPEPVSVLAPAGEVEPKRGPFGLTLPTRRKREGGTLRSIAYASGVAVTLTVAAIGAANLAGHNASEEPGETAPSAAPVETASAASPTGSTLAMALAPVDAPAPGMSGGSVSPTPLAAAPSAAAADEARTFYSSGVRRLESGDAGGLADLRRAANLGLPEAQFHLANLYEEGQSGLAKDAGQARAWMARAAAGGDAKAMFNLGLFYANGDGGPHDDRQAVAWFRRAADLGLHDAQFNLAVMNQNGRGAPPSAAEAYKWFLIAAASGDSGAKASADALKPQIAPDALAAAQRSAGAWRASQAGATPTA